MIVGLVFSSACDDGDGNGDADLDGGADGDADGDVEEDADPDDDAVDGDIDDDGDADSDDDVDTGPAVPGEWITITAGVFMMGSPEDEVGRGPMETLHEATLTHDFELQSTEVTQSQFEEVMGYNPSYFEDCPECPVESISWNESAAYCNVLSDRAGLEHCYECSGSERETSCSPSGSYPTPYDCPGYRLPTNAEWEYAARSGTTTATYNGGFDAEHLACESPNPVLDPIAWFCGNSDSVTHEVQTKDASPWGLHDMLGNVWEWCHDWYGVYSGDAETDPVGPTEGEARVIRGSSWFLDARFTRAAHREGRPPDRLGNYLGLRPSRSLP